MHCLKLMIQNQGQLAAIRAPDNKLLPVLFPVTIFFCLLASISHGSEHVAGVEDREVELETIRTQIKDVQSSIEDARSNVDNYMAEIRKNEMSIMEISANLNTLETRISEQDIKLEQLHSESDTQRQILEYERSLLAEQIRVAYKTGRHDLLKLLLNQENPERIGRMIAYHDYYNRARARRIEEVQITLTNLRRLESAIDSETRKLETFRQEQLQRLDQLASYRDKRTSLIDKLNGFISEQDRDLQNLQRNEEELSGLINELKNSRNVVELYEDLPPFDSLRGKLKWPVEGKLVTRYGSTKKEGKLKWNGVRITTEPGKDVFSVSAGKVIFADWFRNLGLLIIIDHGNGYMSLYGHNERLLKKAGDFVATAEPIARAGNTGGQDTTALYFEIRQQGTPMNPGLWCRS